MVTSPEQPPDAPITFEVFPRSAQEMQELMDFLNGRGMGYRIPPPDETDVFELDKLYEASEELFNTSAHGRSAASLLRAQHRNCHGTATIASSGVVMFRRANLAVPFLSMGTPVTTVDQFSHRSLEEATLRKISATSPPFEVSTLWVPRAKGAGSEAGALNLQFSAANFTNSALKKYVAARSYHQHGLTGNMGKALSTLARAAGYNAVPLDNLDCTSELVSREELLAKMQEKIHLQNISYARDKLNKILLEQLFSGQKAVHGEVVLGGSKPFELVNTPKGYEVRYGEIVRGSLAVVAASYTRETSASRFWREMSGV